MTLDEAKHRIQLELDGNPSLQDIKLRKAMQLDIEAIKELEQVRKYAPSFTAARLPGETPE